MYINGYVCIYILFLFLVIEGELEIALYKAGLITSQNFGELRKINMSRSSRTDKGVNKDIFQYHGDYVGDYNRTMFRV
jgi:hypothetical protein